MSVIMDFHHLGEGVCIWQWNKNLSLNSLSISNIICHFVNHTSNNLGLVGDRNEFLVFGSSVALYCISESNELPCLSGGWLSWLGEATSKKKGFFHIVIWWLNRWYIHDCWHPIWVLQWLEHSNFNCLFAIIDIVLDLVDSSGNDLGLVTYRSEIFILFARIAFHNSSISNKLLWHLEIRILGLWHSTNQLTWDQW